MPPEPAPEKTHPGHTMVLAALMCGVAGLVAWAVLGFTYAETDPDRPYHFAVSRLWADVGLVRSLPQVRGLGWDAAFADKEFLFHVLTGLGWKLGGETGTAAVGPALAVLLLALLGACAAQVGGLAAALLGVGACVLGNAEIVVRLLLLRPHVLAMVAFVALLWALLRRNGRAVGVTAAAFALAYHGIFVPAALLGVVGLYGVLFNRALVRLSVWGAVGIGVGVLANPYFPENVLLGLTHLKLALNPQLGLTVDIGLESVPLRSDTFVTAYLFTFVLLAAAALCLRGRARQDNPDVENTEWLAAAALLFVLLAMKNPRAGEYAGPLLAVLCAAVVRMDPRAGLPLLGAAVLACVVPTWNLVSRGVPQKPLDDAANNRAAARAIPTDIPGALVFNCEWFRSSYVIHERPDLAVLDVLEPALLAEHAPEASAFRAALLAGQVPDPSVFLTHRLNAAYVFCQNPGVVAQLESDPAFARVFPADDPVSSIPLAQPRVYRVLETPPSFVLHMQGQVLRGMPVDALWKVTPQDARTPVPVEQAVAEGVWRPFVDLRALAPGTPGKDTGSCGVVRPTASEMARLAGATVLGLGGGRVLRAFLNGKALFSTGAAFPQPRLLQVLVPLPQPLLPTDVLEVVACSSDAQPYLGVALSLWTQAPLDEACRRHIPPTRTLPIPEDAAWRGSTRTHCLAPWAAPAR